MAVDREAKDGLDRVVLGRGSLDDLAQLFGADAVVHAVGAQQVAITDARGPQHRVDLRIDDAAVAGVDRACHVDQHRSNELEVVRARRKRSVRAAILAFERVVLGAALERAVTKPVAARVADVRQRDVLSRDEQRGEARARVEDGRRVGDGVVDPQPQLAGEREAAVRGREIDGVFSGAPLREGVVRALGGDHSRRLAAHSIDDRAELSRGVDEEVVFVVIAGRSGVGSTGAAKGESGDHGRAGAAVSSSRDVAGSSAETAGFFVARLGVAIGEEGTWESRGSDGRAVRSPPRFERMGRESATRTLALIFAELIEKRTIVQAEVARKLEIKSETVAAKMAELREGGIPVEREQDGRNVRWRVAKNWFPNAVVFEKDEAQKLLLLLLRGRRSATRDAFVARLTAAVPATKGARDAVREANVERTTSEQEDSCRSVIELAMLSKRVVSMRYQGTDDDEPRWRTASPQTIVNSENPYVIAFDHDRHALRHFRFDRMSRAIAEDSIAFRSVDDELVERNVRESMHGYCGGELREVSFVVAMAVWNRVKDNLPFVVTHSEPAEGGVRVVVNSRAGRVLTRFLLAHSTDVQIETDVVREEVVAAARAAIEHHTRTAREVR